jgi:Na+/H+ antiporter NhaC
MSPVILAIVLIAAGIVIVFFLSGFQIFRVLSPGTSEEVVVSIKQNNVCIVEASDNVPRQIQDCQYDEGQRITIVYKYEQPAIESHSPVS